MLKDLTENVFFGIKMYMYDLGKIIILDNFGNATVNHNLIHVHVHVNFAVVFRKLDNIHCRCGHNHLG